MAVDPYALAELVAPTSADVAAVLRARTKDLTGDELADFTENTRPTGEEVERLIEIAYDEVTAVSGLHLAPRCAGLARVLIIVRAAMWVEGSYWPEQVRSDRSIFTELADRYDDGLPILRDCVAGNLPGDGAAEDDLAGYRFGVLDVHGWTASPYYGTPDVRPESDDGP